MRARKLSISLSQQEYNFIEQYQSEHHYKTRSLVIKEALFLLQQAQLEACYHDANKELDNTFDVSTSDGIDENETW